MTFGLLDLATPALQWLDDFLALGLPPSFRIALYGVGCGALGMWIYRARIDHAALAQNKVLSRQARVRLGRHDGSFAQLLVIARDALHLSLHRLRLVFLASCIAAIPMLFVLPWLSNSFESRAPSAGEALRACWHNATEPPRCGTVSAPLQAASLASIGVDASWLPSPAPPSTGVLHGKRWWNFLIANPSGYLSAAAGDGVLTVALPKPKLIGVALSWAHNWALWFFLPLLLVSAALHLRWRLS